MKSWMWSSKPWQAFKTFAILFSFTVNLIFVVVLLIAAPLIIPIVNQIAAPIVGGLNQSFVDMGQAHIVRTIEVEDNIPIQFDLPLSTNTTVVGTEPVPMSVNAQFILPGGGGVINGTVNLELPEGLALPIELDLMVPVSQTIPVSLDVAVDIPMEETELGQPFESLQALFAPLDRFLSRLPASNDELYDRIVNTSDPASQPLAVDTEPN